MSQVVPARIRRFPPLVQMANAMLIARTGGYLQIMMEFAMDRANFGMGSIMSPIALMISTQGLGRTLITTIVWQTILLLQPARDTMDSITHPAVLAIKQNLQVY